MWREPMGRVLDKLIRQALEERRREAQERDK